MKKFNDYDLSESAEVFNFNRDVVNYIDDNMRYLKEINDSPTAEDFVDYYNLSAEAFNDDCLTSEAEKQFLFVASTVLKDGYFPHAGVLSDH